MKRKIEKHIMLNEEENYILKMKARKCGLSEASFLRALLCGYVPKESPSQSYYELMQEMSAIGNNVNQLAQKAHKLNFIDAVLLDKLLKEWNELKIKIERDALLPERGTIKWQ